MKTMKNIKTIKTMKKMNTMNTITIDPRMKELYYKAEEVKETQEAIEARYTYWNYMLNVSVQNMMYHNEKAAC